MKKNVYRTKNYNISISVLNNVDIIFFYLPINIVQSFKYYI